MKKVLLLAGLFFAGSTLVTGQTGISSDEQEKIKQLFRKDTSYDRFRSELKQVMKTAKGPNSNVAAVKKLFTKNKSMLSNMISANKIIPSVQPAWGPVTIYSPTVLGELPQNKGIATRRFSYLAPYNDQFTGGFYAPRQLEKVYNDLANGKIGYKYDNWEDSGYLLGTSTITFIEKIPVQNSPQLVTARVEFQYSFMVTGWDTKFADFEIGLYLRCSNFRSDAFLALPPLYEDHPDWLPSARKVKVLVPRMSVEDDIESFSKTVEGSFIIDGYIDPSDEMSFRIEAAYGVGDRGGLFGSYHYGEFKLKKIIVSYFRAGD